MREIAVRIIKGKPDADHALIATDLRMEVYFSDIKAGSLLSLPGGRHAIRLLAVRELEEHKDEKDLCIISSNDVSHVIIPLEVADIFQRRSIFLLISQSGNRYLSDPDRELLEYLEEIDQGGAE